MRKLFIDHLASVGEKYLERLITALGISSDLLVAALTSQISVERVYRL